MLNSNNILYLFDFDGTLLGDNEWISMYHNTKSCVLGDCYLNPSDKNIRWSILTGRPKIDKLIIRAICIIKGLCPKKIITTPTWFYMFQEGGNMANYTWKSNVIKKILDDDSNGIDIVYYIDNDIDCIAEMNQMSEGYQYHCMHMMFFINEQFTNFI